MKWDYRYIDPYHCHHHPIYWEKAYKYAKAMAEGANFPPVHVHLDRFGRYIVKNGAHRTAAAKLTGRDLFIKISSQHNWSLDEKEYTRHTKIFKR